MREVYAVSDRPSMLKPAGEVRPVADPEAPVTQDQGDLVSRSDMVPSRETRGGTMLRPRAPVVVRTSIGALPLPERSPKVQTPCRCG